MEPKIFSPNPRDEFFTEEKCHILEIINTSDFNRFSLAQARVEPGITTEWHSVKETDELYYILKGEGNMEIGNSFRRKITKGEAVLIPKNERQRITNIGNSDLIFLCICSPRFEVRNYQSE